MLERSAALASGGGRLSGLFHRQGLAPGGAGAVENRAGYRNCPIPSSGSPGSRGAKRWSSLLTLNRGPRKTYPARIIV
jgi:hypothetical protein